MITNKASVRIYYAFIFLGQTSRNILAEFIIGMVCPLLEKLSVFYKITFVLFCFGTFPPGIYENFSCSKPEPTLGTNSL